jgi:hypothetical protein
MVGLIWPEEIGAKGNREDVPKNVLTGGGRILALRDSRARGMYALAVCTRSSRCTVWLMWHQDTGVNMVILNLQNFHSSRRRSNVRAVRSSSAPAARSSPRQIILCMLCMLQGYSLHNIIVTEGRS